MLPYLGKDTQFDKYEHLIASNSLMTVFSFFSVNKFSLVEMDLWQLLEADFFWVKMFDNMSVIRAAQNFLLFRLVALRWLTYCAFKALKYFQIWPFANLPKINLTDLLLSCNVFSRNIFPEKNFMRFLLCNVLWANARCEMQTSCQESTPLKYMDVETA